MSQHSFNAASASWCRNPSFYVVIASLFKLCCNTILYYLHFCHDRGLLPLSLTSCCNLVLMLRHGFLVFVKYLLSRHDSSVFSLIVLSRSGFHVATELLCIMLKSLSRHRKVYRDLVYLYSAYFCVATLISMS